MQRYFDNLSIALRKEFPGQLLLQGKPDPATTGNFEVRILSTNNLIHSKATRRGKGENLCQTPSEMDNVVSQIREHLKEHPLS